MDFKKELKTIQKALLTECSYMMPLVVAGGISFAISLIGGTATDGGMQTAGPVMENIKLIGKAGLFMMVPVMSAYIAYSIAGRPGLTPGFILGYIANNTIGETGVKSGFLGALVLGVIAGYFVKWMKSWNVPNYIKSIMPILIIPLLSTFVIGLAYIYILAIPLSSLLNWLIAILTELNGTNQILFAVVLGAICEIDMGGPLTKTVTMFTIALISEGIYAPNGMYRVCVGIPPLAIFLSTLMFKNKWTDADRSAAQTAGVMGVFGLTEGAIPFAIADLKHILPANILGCIVGSVIACLTGVESAVPHGSFITLPMVTNKIWFCVAIIAGTLVAAVAMGLMRKPVEDSKIAKKN